MINTKTFEFWFGLALGIAIASNVYALVHPWTPDDPDSHQNFLQTWIGWILLWSCFMAAWIRQRRFQRITSQPKTHPIPNPSAPALQNGPKPLDDNASLAKPR